MLNALIGNVSTGWFVELVAAICLLAGVSLRVEARPLDRSAPRWTQRASLPDALAAARRESPTQEAASLDAFIVRAPGLIPDPERRMIEAPRSNARTLRVLSAPDVAARGPPRR